MHLLFAHLSVACTTRDLLRQGRELRALSFLAACRHAVGSPLIGAVAKPAILVDRIVGRQLPQLAAEHRGDTIYRCVKNGGGGALTG